LGFYTGRLGFQIGGLDIGFPVGSAIPAEVVDHEIDVLIVAPGHDRRRPNLF